MRDRKRQIFGLEIFSLIVGIAASYVSIAIIYPYFQSQITPKDQLSSTAAPEAPLVGPTAFSEFNICSTSATRELVADCVEAVLKKMRPPNEDDARIVGLIKASIHYSKCLGVYSIEALDDCVMTALSARGLISNAPAPNPPPTTTAGPARGNSRGRTQNSSQVARCSGAVAETIECTKQAPVGPGNGSIGTTPSRATTVLPR